MLYMQISLGKSFLRVWIAILGNEYLIFFPKNWFGPWNELPSKVRACFSYFSIFIKKLVSRLIKAQPILKSEQRMNLKINLKILGLTFLDLHLFLSKLLSCCCRFIWKNLQISRKIYSKIGLKIRSERTALEPLKANTTRYAQGRSQILISMTIHNDSWRFMMIHDDSLWRFTMTMCADDSCWKMDAK